MRSASHSGGVSFLQWSRAHDDRFFHATSSCVTLYEVGDEDDSCSSIGRVVGAVDNMAFLRAFDVHTTHEHLIVCGHASGRIALHSLDASSSNNAYAQTTSANDTPSSCIGEMGVGHQRACNAIKCNTQYRDLLAAAYDRYKGESAVRVWDLQRYSSPSASHSPMRPLCELCPSEGACSVEWLSDRRLLVGLGGRSIVRLCDLRDTSKHVLQVLTKATLGICVNPSNDNQFASYSFDGHVVVHDIRSNRSDRPLVAVNVVESPSIATPALLQLAWDAQRRNTVHTLANNSAYLNALTMHRMEGEEEMSTTQRFVYAGDGSNDTISSFALHARHAGRIISVGTHSMAISIRSICERSVVRFDTGPRSEHMAVSFGHELGDVRLITDDIDHKMYDRVLRGYGVMPKGEGGEELVRSRGGQFSTSARHELILKHMLSVLCNEGEEEGRRMCHAIRYMIQWSRLRQTVGGCSPGTYSLCPSAEHVLSTSVTTSAKTGKKLIIYSSASRHLLLRLCGWQPMDGAYIENSDARHVNGPALSVKAVNEILLTARDSLNVICRAAAVAVFQFCFARALQLLASASTDGRDECRLCAMVVQMAGESTTNSWHALCKSTRESLRQPYLMAICDFMIGTSTLTCQSDTILPAPSVAYASIYSNAALGLMDRLAFGCVHADDSSLAAWLGDTLDTGIDEGHIDCICLTGLQQDAAVARLLQRYVDLTCDVQSVGLLLSLSGTVHPNYLTNRRAPSTPSRAQTPMSSVPMSKNPSSTHLPFSPTSAGDSPLSPPLHLLNEYVQWLNARHMFTYRSELHCIATEAYRLCCPPDKADAVIRQATPPTVQVLCIYCSRNVALPGPRSTSQTSQQRSSFRQLSTRLPISSAAQTAVGQSSTTKCPYCSKELPRCFVCRRFMGSVVDDFDAQPGVLHSLRRLQLASSVSFCVTCKHYAHAEHANRWFATHRVCGEGSCQCPCQQLDEHIA